MYSIIWGVPNILNGRNLFDMSKSLGHPVHICSVLSRTDTIVILEANYILRRGD